MSNLTNYIAYFRRLATAHKNIRHNPDSETGDAPVESKHFCKWNAEEVIAGLRTKVSFSPAALLIELYETDLVAQQAYDIKPRTKGAFTVLCKALQKDTADEERAMTLAEDIVYDILRQVWLDHHGDGTTLCNTPFRRFWFDRMQITAVGPLFDSCFGYRVEFDFEFQKQINVVDAPDAGVFLDPINEVLTDFVLRNNDGSALLNNDDNATPLQNNQ